MFADENKSFEVKVFKDVYWVPMHFAGARGHTDNELKLMISKTAEQKQNQIKTIYDALNYLRLSNYKDDIEDRTEIFDSRKGINWEYHKTGYASVSDNSGCCSSCASALLYLLDKNYDSSGYVGCIRPNFSGHVWTWFRKNEWYYVVDPTTYIAPYSNYMLRESGDMKDFARRKYITNGLVKARTLQRYIEYFKRYLSYKKCSLLLYYYNRKDDRSAPIGLTGKNLRREIVFPMGYDIRVDVGDPEIYRMNWNVPPQVN